MEAKADFDKSKEMEMVHPTLKDIDADAERKIRKALTTTYDDGTVSTKITSPEIMMGISGPILNVESIHQSDVRKLDEAGFFIRGFWVAPDHNGDPTSSVQIVVDYKDE